jgi:pyruvate dehydrogenase E1 component alpha subunit
MARVPGVADRAAAYGIPAVVVDGNDVEAVHRATLDAAERCRSGDGPVLIEAETYRWHGHYEGDAQPYKPEDESVAWRERDPLLAAGRLLVERGEAGEDELERVRGHARERVQQAVEAARAADGPDPREAFADVFAS